MEYILVDIKDYNIEQLIKEKTKISIAIIFEKCKNSEEVITYAKELIEKRIQIEYLGKILIFVWKLRKPKDKWLNRRNNKYKRRRGGKENEYNKRKIKSRICRRI